MTRRSTPQKKVDVRAFPVRVRVKVPERGFGNMLQTMHDWLRDELGPHNAASHSSGLWATCYYFRDVLDAYRFMTAFPSLLVDDDTTDPTYTAPGVMGGLPPR